MSEEGTAEEVTVVEEPTTKKTRRRPATPKWETAARDRVKTAIRRFSRPLSDLRGRDANEGDTRMLVTDFLCEALGYDKYENLTTEYRVKGEFADYGVRIDRQLTSFIEVKRVSTKLNERHLRQVLSYAVNEGVEWVLLTNGQVWQAYHITAGLPVQVDKALDVDLLGEGTIASKADLLFYLTIESAQRNLMDAVWKERAATAPASLAAAILDDTVIEAIRRQVRRSTGHNADSARIAEIVRAEVIRPELLD